MGVHRTCLNDASSRIDARYPCCKVLERTFQTRLAHRHVAMFIDIRGIVVDRHLVSMVVFACPFVFYRLFIVECHFIPRIRLGQRHQRFVVRSYSPVRLLLVRR